ncbi:MAG: hypothetical protein V7637_2674 [Mycobacteriales bacterium]
MIGGRFLRWGAVAAGVAVLVSLPTVVQSLPVSDGGLTAAALLAKVHASEGSAYSGYAEAVGGLNLPLTDQFSSLTDLLGDRTRLRVWWRGRDDWRVDAISATGETDLHQDTTGSWTWDYESDHAQRTAPVAVRLPEPADLDPAQLGRRLLSEADAAEVTRLPARRVAGRDAPGLRLRPTDPQTTVTNVDVWVDPDTGAPLRVGVYGGNTARPVVETSYVDFSSSTPSQADTAFEPPLGQHTTMESGTDDLASRVDTFAPFLPPEQLAGYPLRQRLDGLGSVGTYGRGVTVLAAVPLPGQVAFALDRQLDGTPGIQQTSHGPMLSVGPLSLLLTGRERGGRSWLLTGTMTPAALLRAADDLARAPLRLR